MQSRRAGLRNSMYLAYRKVRYLAHTGSLFTSSSAKYGGNITEKGVFTKITINSTFLFLIAYLVNYTIHLMVTGYAALAFDIPVVVYYYDVDFLIRGIDWTPDSVTGVFSSSPLATLILTLLLIILFKSVETESGLSRMLLLWMIFIGFTRVFGEIMIGAIMGKGFGFVMAYLFVMDTGKVTFTLLGAVALIIIGIFLSRMSLYTANTYFNDLLGSYRTRFVTSQFILPYLIGNFVLFVVKMPEINYYDLFLNSTLILLLIPLVVRSARFEDFYFDQDPRTNRISFPIAITAIILLALFRIIFGIGLRL
jgi:hypothetical protein